MTAMPPMPVARITRGKLGLRPAQVTLAQVVETAVETARPAIERKCHVLRVELPEPPVALQADPLRLSQILANLFTNAAKYTDPGGHIELRARVQAEELMISVSDDGLGIEAEALPGAQPPSGASALDAALRILIADDNADAAESLGMLLQLEGHEVRIATDGRAALDAAARFDPPVALLDLGMPDLDGYAVARALRASGRAELTLVAVTGWGRDEHRERTRAAGCDVHLTKPVDPADLGRVLARVGAGAPLPREVPWRA